MKSMSSILELTLGIKNTDYPTTIHSLIYPLSADSTTKLIDYVCIHITCLSKYIVMCTPNHVLSYIFVPILCISPMIYAHNYVSIYLRM